MTSQRQCGRRGFVQRTRHCSSMLDYGVGNRRSNCCVFVISVFVIFSTATVHDVRAIKWLATSGVKWNSPLDCTLGVDVVSALSPVQRQLCARHIDLMDFVSTSALLTVDLCQELFADRRWNCSSVLFAPNFLPDLTGGSREQGFVYALSAASLVHTIAKACSSGQSSKCQCAAVPDDDEESAPDGHRWGGCGDDVDFAAGFGRQFVGVDPPTNAPRSRKGSRGKRQKRPNGRTLVNRHNSAAGISLLSSNLRATCKCHGVSGACTIKTCFKALPVLRHVAAQLQARHVTAVQVRPAGSREQKPDTSSGDQRRQRRLVAVQTGSRKMAVDDLIYYTISSDYCLPDAALGSVGTHNRECRPEAEESAAGVSASSTCRSMCCGRGHVTSLVNTTRRCDCKYYWCCYVRCKTCSSTVAVHRCR